ncbi:MAG: prepilin-type N-terminal cleavage/methylation domain-containing protein [Kiritimatiellia bacterium]|jgi:prepilin-type N-terminal cleavage/methylation domain-containing protein
MGRFHDNRSGFTLMEVNIALLVIAVGLTSLLALFPVGLRESNTATADTVQTAASSYIFARLHENAEKNDWGDQPAKVIGKGFTFNNSTTPFAGNDETGFEGTPIRYQLKIGEVGGYGGLLYYAALRVSDRETGDLSREPLFYTEFVRKGVLP